MTLRLLLLLGLLHREPHEPAEARQDRWQRADAAMLAAAGASRDLYAALLVLGALETGFAERFERDGCRPKECDRGKAKHYWQAHRANCPALWRDPTSTPVAARCAAATLRYGRKLCGNWAGAFNVYAGLRCGATLGAKREQLRAKAMGL